MIGIGPNGDTKDHMTDEEYGEYLKQSQSFSGRLWANLDSREEMDLDDSGASTWSISDLYESSEPSTSTRMDDRPIPEFSHDDMLSSTFIIDDTELAASLSRDESWDDTWDYGEEALIQLIIRDNGAQALGKPMTNPCA